MKQKPITGNPSVGKKHVVFLTLLNLGSVLLYLGYWMLAVYTDLFPNPLVEFSYMYIGVGLWGLFITVFGYGLVLLKFNLARVIMEMIYFYVGLGTIILFLRPISLYTFFPLLCLFDFVVLFIDKHIYAYCHPREVQDKDAETGKGLPLN